MLRVKLLDPAARAPEVAHPGEDLGYDLFALEPATLTPHATVRIRTGIAVEARHPATGIPLGLLVRDRSSMAAKGIATTAGVIDAGYRGEIKVALINLDPAVPIVVHRGDRIAQLLVQRVELVDLVEVSSFDEAGLADTSRGEGGHGSSGGHASL